MLETCRECGLPEVKTLTIEGKPFYSKSVNKSDIDIVDHERLEEHETINRGRMRSSCLEADPIRLSTSPCYSDAPLSPREYCTCGKKRKNLHTIDIYDQ